MEGLRWRADSTMRRARTWRAQTGTRCPVPPGAGAVYGSCLLWSQTVRSQPATERGAEPPTQPRAAVCRTRPVDREEEPGGLHLAVRTEAGPWEERRGGRAAGAGPERRVGSRAHGVGGKAPKCVPLHTARATLCSTTPSPSPEPAGPALHTRPRCCVLVSHHRRVPAR